MDKWINEPDSESEDEAEDVYKDNLFSGASKTDAHRKLFYEEDKEVKPKKTKKGRKGKGKKKGRRTGIEEEEEQEEGYDSDQIKEVLKGLTLITIIEYNMYTYMSNVEDLKFADLHVMI